MFEHSLIDLAAQKRRRSWHALPLAIAVHLLVAGSVAFASYWNIADVPEPDVNVVFFQAAPPPPPPAPRGNPAPKPPAPAAAPERPVVRPQTLQPVDIPDELPPVDPAPAAPLSDVITDVVGSPDGGDDGAIGGDGPGVPRGDGVGGADGGAGGGPVVVDAPAGSQPIRIGGAVKKPEELYRTSPRYTEMARRAGVQGVVVLEAVIDERGLVADVRVLRGLPMGLDQAAVEAVQKWRYKPATLHGQPVKVYFTLTVNFTLQR